MRNGELCGTIGHVRRTAAMLLEVAAVLAAVVLGGKGGLILLLVAGSAVLALRGGRWFEPRDARDGAGWAALGGLVVGLAGLAAAGAISPSVLAVTGRAVEWSTQPVVRGSVGLAATVMLVTLTFAVAAEMVFRRWLLDRIAAAALARESRAAALAAGVLAAALIEAAVSPVGDGPRLGTALMSGGLGVIYVASGGRLVACLSARVAFELGAVVVQALKLTA